MIHGELEHGSWVEETTGETQLGRFAKWEPTSVHRTRGFGRVVRVCVSAAGIQNGLRSRGRKDYGTVHTS
jgi:hypothetical protein